jgi:hypothetical protein
MLKSKRTKERNAPHARNVDLSKKFSAIFLVEIEVA